MGITGNPETLWLRYILRNFAKSIGAILSQNMQSLKFCNLDYFEFTKCA